MCVNVCVCAVKRDNGRDTTLQVLGDYRQDILLLKQHNIVGSMSRVEFVQLECGLYKYTVLWALALPALS